MYFVFVCRKCGHHLYAQANQSGAIKVSALDELARRDCPNCGEQGEENWALGFKAKNFPGEEGEP